MFTCESTICFFATCFYVGSYQNMSLHCNYILLILLINVLLCRKVLQERNDRNSNDFYFRIYILVVGVYAALRLFLGLIVKVPACHSLSAMSDQPFFQFFKWIYQVYSVQCVPYWNIERLVYWVYDEILIDCLLYLLFCIFQERYYVGRGLYERMSDYCRFAFVPKEVQNWFFKTCFFYVFL